MSMDKRRKLMRMIVEADEKGIDELWNRINGKDTKKTGASCKDIEHAFSEIAAKQFSSDPFTMMFLAALCVEVTEELFKEE